MRMRKGKLLLILGPIFFFLFYLDVSQPKKSISMTTLSPAELDPADAAASDTTKYLIYTCERCGGWADRLKGLLSSYALALLLNRTFIVQLEQPCPLSKLLDANRVQWNQKLPDRIDEHDKFVYDIAQNFYVIKEVNGEASNETASKINKNIVRDLESVDFFSLTDKKYLYVNADIMFANAFPKNRFMQARIRELGYRPDEFTVLQQTYRWYNELFKLPKRLEAKYADFVREAKPNKNAKLICAQLRVGSKTGKDNQDLFFMTRDQTAVYWELLKTEFTGKLFADGNYKIFVTSDREDVKQEAVQVFGADKVIATQNSSMHFGIDVNQANDPRCPSLENVLYDFSLLSNCDAAAVSHSGFGILAMLNRPEPGKNLFVYSLADQSILRDSYWNRAGKPYKFHKIENVGVDLIDKVYFT